MSEPNFYAKHERSTVNRYRKRATYDFSTIHSIVNTASILHVSFLPADISIDPFPTILPMLGQMSSFSNPSADPAKEPLDLYIHGHSSSRLMRLPESSVAQPEGLPVCVAATLLDGIVLALTPFNHSCNYRSAIIYGYASTVTDEAEKLFAMETITNGIASGRWENSRQPPTRVEMQSTTILRITVENASAKIRVGGPGDDRTDLKNEAVVQKVWTGVVPVWEHLGEPEASETNAVAERPPYLDEWREGKNGVGKQYSSAAATMKKK